MASKYDSETKERVVRLYRERRLEVPEESASASLRRLRELLDIPVDTMRGWVTRADVDSGSRSGFTSAELGEIRQLKKEVAELRRANEILKTASAFFAAAELDRRLK